MCESRARPYAPCVAPEALRCSSACAIGCSALPGCGVCCVAPDAAWFGSTRDRTLPAFETGERRLRSVLDGLDTARIELEETLLVNVNTPADLDTLAP